MPFDLDIELGFIDEAMGADGTGCGDETDVVCARFF